eukprot:gene4386-7761_t
MRKLQFLILFCFIYFINSKFCYSNQNCISDFKEEFPKCPGLYCGRKLINDNYLDSLNCGSCSRGYKSDGWVCKPCSDQFELYPIFYLIFMFGLVPLSFFWSADENTKRNILKPIFFSLFSIQTIISAGLSFLISFPDFKFNVCKVQLFSDWYPYFFYTSMKCTNEVVFPLYSIVFIFYGFCLLFTILITIPLVHLLKENIYNYIFPLWLIPIFSLIHFIFAGIIYFTWPYLLLISFSFIDYFHIRRIWKEEKPFEILKILKRILIFVLRNILIIWGIISIFLFFNLSRWYYFFGLIPPLVSIYNLIFCFGFSKFWSALIKKLESDDEEEKNE